MKLIVDRCCAANDSMFLLPSRSVSPNAYSAPLVENKMRASANVIHPRSSGGNANKERASVASVVPSSFMASGGAATSAPHSFAIRLIIAIFGSLSGEREFDAVRHVGHHFLLVLFAPLDSTASESFGGRCVDVVQFHFQESLGYDQRADSRTNVAVARCNHLVGSGIQRIRFLEQLRIGRHARVPC